MHRKLKGTLDIEAARRLVLAAQALSRRWPFGKGKAGVLGAIEHLGYIQIDTISVVERAHLHALWSRTESRPAQHLKQLQAFDHKVFEHWAHAAAYLPMRDFRYSLPFMEQIRQNGSPWHRHTDPDLCAKIIARIREEGALKARDFQAPDNFKPGTWWHWKPAKRELEAMFMDGRLMISHREGMEKVYDLSERILPKTVNTRIPGYAEQARWMIDTALRAQGLVGAEDINYAIRNISTQRSSPLPGWLDTTFAKLLKSGELVQTEVAGKLVYLRPQSLENLPRASSRTHILSPFDNLVIQRKRLKWLFGYDYKIECYVPAPKRLFGYFCLPILRGSRFLGRMDAKAERKEGRLNVVALHLEQGIPGDDKTAENIAEALRGFARFNLCEDIKISATRSGTFRRKLQAALGHT